MTVQLQVDLTDEVSEGLQRVADATSGLPELLDSIGGALVASTQQRFLDEESPEGEAWAEHSDATVAMRGPGADILRQDNHLFDTLDHKVEGSKVAVGVNRVYARIHQLGGEAGRGRKVRIPARPYLGVSEDDRKEVGAIVTEYLEGAA